MTSNVSLVSPVRVRQRSRPPIADAAIQHADRELSRAVAHFEAKVVERRLVKLKPAPRNAPTHGKKQIHLIAESIKAFGFVAPVLIVEHDVIVAGQGRFEVAKVLGQTNVPTICLDHLSRTNCEPLP